MIDGDLRIIITMVHSWLIKILLCFSHAQLSRKKQQEKSTPCFMMTNQEKSQTVASYLPTYHIFSSPLKLSMLRKVRCRIRSRTSDTNPVALPLPVASFEQQPIASFLNESQNCAEKLRYECVPSTIRCKQYPSLVAIDIGNNEPSQEQMIR
jgi:hypothetical protein